MNGNHYYPNVALFYENVLFEGNYGFVLSLLFLLKFRRSSSALWANMEVPSSISLKNVTFHNNTGDHLGSGLIVYGTINTVFPW